MYTLFKIEGTNRGTPEAVVTINGKALSIPNKITVSWGDCSPESTALAKTILTSFIKNDYQNNSSTINILSKRFVENFCNGWGEGNFSVEINIQKFFADRGYDYFYEPFKN